MSEFKIIQIGPILHVGIQMYYGFKLKKAKPSTKLLALHFSDKNFISFKGNFKILILCQPNQLIIEFEKCVFDNWPYGHFLYYT